MSFLRRWCAFAAERFPPLENIPMVAAFFAPYAVAGSRHNAAGSESARLVTAGLILLSFFFRLRVFDEIKDHATDSVLNPARPLARGLIGLGEAKRLALALFLGEALASAPLGLEAAIGWILPAGFSLLMYREFFCGRWLRPKMELYAITHTFVAGLMALMVFTMVSGTLPWRAYTPTLSFAFASWMVFNVYEFARKSFALSEERKGADSYTLRLGPAGAALLISSQAILALALAWSMPLGSWPRLGLAVTTSALLALCLAFALRPNPPAALAMRRGSGLFIFGFYALSAAGLSWGSQTP